MHLVPPKKLQLLIFIFILEIIFLLILSAVLKDRVTFKCVLKQLSGAYIMTKSVSEAK